MSWAAHQFEVYAIQAHLPKKMQGKVSFWGIWLGDFTPDFLAKFWVYGITINGVRYGADNPEKWHRGWPGMGFTHTLFLGALFGLGLWLWRRNRALTVGYVLGFAAHALTDANDSVGTMMLFPFSTTNWSLQTWAYSATKEGGKYFDAAAYYSSLGVVMDVFWLVVVLFSWRVFTRKFWLENVVPPEARLWSWLSRRMPERVMLALYRATFFYGVTRLTAWFIWARLLSHSSIGGVERTGFPLDLSWTGPWWVRSISLPHVNPWIVLPMAVLLFALVYVFFGVVWDRMGDAERRRRAAKSVAAVGPAG